MGGQCCLNTLPKCYQKLKVCFEAKKCTKIVAQLKLNPYLCNVRFIYKHFKICDYEN